jgi:anti-anti-sigma factor
VQESEPPIGEVQHVAGSAGEASDDGRPETRLQRLDRNLEEMTGELRVVVTGVQVLFAFLLVVPFDQGFNGVGPFERTVYFVTLLCSALAALCTIAPAAYHRMLFRSDDKRHVVFFANRIVIVGLAFLALAMCGSLLLVTSKLFGAAAGIVTAALMAVPFASLWFLLPLGRRTAPGPGNRGRSDGAPWLDGADSRAARVARAREPAELEDSQSWLGNPVRYDFGVSAQEHLRVETRRAEDRVVLHLTGELDLASSSIFERALDDPGLVDAPLVVLDLDELRFVDSTGLRVILKAHEAARGRGQEFAITRGSPQVQRLLSITSVAEHMHVLAAADDLLV